MKNKINQIFTKPVKTDEKPAITRPTPPWPIMRIAALLAILAVIIMLPHTSIGGSLAFLYIFGFDGKVSGRTGGNVYARNGTGHGFTVPRLVRNAFTMFVRNSLAYLSAQWNSINTVDAAAWNAYNVTRTNRLGNTYKVFGKAAFVGLNQNLLNVGAATLSTPPPLGSAIPQIVVNTIGATVSTPLVRLSTDPTVVGISYEFFFTAQQSVNTSRPGSSKFRLLTVAVGTGSGLAINMVAAYEARFGALVTGNRIFGYVQAVDTATGIASVPSAILTTIVGA